MIHSEKMRNAGFPCDEPLLGVFFSKKIKNPPEFRRVNKFCLDFVRLSRYNKALIYESGGISNSHLLSKG